MDGFPLCDDLARTVSAGMGSSPPETLQRTSGYRQRMEANMTNINFAATALRL